MIIDKTMETIEYQRKKYTIAVPNTWQHQVIDEQCVAFFGPKIGVLRMGLYITTVAKEGKTYVDAANKMKIKQESERNHAILEEQNISEENSKAFMRRSCWYNPNVDMTLFVREIFTEFEDTIFILSCSIPNTDDLEELDREVIQMMNSFKFRS